MSTGLPEFEPYRVQDSTASRAEVFAFTNDQVYQGFGSDYAYGGAGKLVAGTLFDFERLLQRLTALAHLEFVTHRELLAEPCPADRVRVGIRHDVDMDVVAALAQAELEQAYGVKANWVILHTAPYYGYFKNGVFHRHRCMIHVYRRLQALGHEVSIHSDPLLLYQEHGIDGAQALRTEIEWLRSNGVDVRGSTAHNHRPTYGAENYEVFKGYVRPADRGKPLADRVEHNGKWAPLRVLDERALGLEYEGNEVFWQRHTVLHYGAIRLADHWNWHAHQRRLKDDPGIVDRRFIDQERLLGEIGGLPRGGYLVLVVHPVYYGNRASPRQSPVRRSNRIRRTTHPVLGWRTYDPEHTQCWSGDPSAPQAFQAVHKPNAMGMLDLPWPQGAHPAGPTVLLLGADNLDGLPVHVPSQIQTVLGELLRTRLDVNARVVKLAHPGMGVSRLWAWYDKVRQELRPDIVVAGIDDEVLRKNLPRVWSRETGYSAQYPPAPYLAWSPREEGVVTVRPATDWYLHRRDPHGLERDPDTGLPLEAVPAQTGQSADARVADALRYVTACYRHLAEAVGADGGRLFLLLEGLGESAGYFHDPARAAHRVDYQHRARERLAAIADELEVTFVDPYPAMEAEYERLPSHYPNERRWNVTGHRLAALALFAALKASLGEADS